MQAEPPADQGADSLAMLAAALVKLSAADRAKLAAMLLQANEAAQAMVASEIDHDGR